MTPPPRFTDEGRRLGVDMTFARIEDAIRTLRKDAPLNEAERAHCQELARELDDLAAKS
jgi:hypothetical protein